jgi:hypothetical protein
MNKWMAESIKHSMIESMVRAEVYRPWIRGMRKLATVGEVDDGNRTWDFCDGVGGRRYSRAQGHHAARRGGQRRRAYALARGGPSPLLLETAKVNEMATYFSALPYIVRVAPGAHSVLDSFVHAGLRDQRGGSGRAWSACCRHWCVNQHARTIGGC